MHKLSDFKEDINKCSKCGLCQAVCPIYKITGNDCAVSRGKFVMLSGVLKGDLKLSKNINKYLDMCLKCGKCKGFCPSGIDACKIFETAKYEYSKDKFLSKIIFFMQSKLIFNNLLKFFEKIIPHKKHSNLKSSKSTKLLLFRGCADKILPNAENATRKILSNFPDIELIEKDFDCCGVPFLSSGNLERFEEAKRKNNEIINSTEFDYIITDCATCEDALKNSFPEIVDKIINFAEFLSQQAIKFKFKKHHKVTFHKPCHLKNYQAIKDIFKNCENIDYIEMKDYDECCGFAGEFALKNPKLSTALRENKAQNIISSGADIVLTLCPACIIGLKAGLFGKKNPPKVMNLIEFLASTDVIE